MLCLSPYIHFDKSTCQYLWAVAMLQWGGVACQREKHPPMQKTNILHQLKAAIGCCWCNTIIVCPVKIGAHTHPTQNLWCCKPKPKTYWATNNHRHMVAHKWWGHVAHPSLAPATPKIYWMANKGPAPKRGAATPSSGLACWAAHVTTQPNLKFIVLWAQI